MNQKKRLSVKTVVLIGMFGALAAVLETFQIPVPFAPPFYKLDFAETPIMIGAFAPVNKNDTAPIFEIADYGICGDLFKVTPMLIEAIKAAKAAK